MVRRDGAEARKERIAEIARIIQSALYEAKDAGWIQLSTWVTKIMIRTGLTRNKVMEIMKLLSDDGQFELDETNYRISRPIV
jgi:ABC-type taurine transport system substrate-binding protein